MGILRNTFVFLLLFHPCLFANSLPGQPKHMDIDEYLDWVGHSSGPAGPGRESYARDSYNVQVNENFGSGIATTTASAGDDKLRSVVLQTDGRILSVGPTLSVPDTWLSRQNPDGSLDTSFSSTGRAVFTLGSNDELVHAVALQSDGRAVIAGRASKSIGVDLDFLVARILTNGSLDTSFATRGYIHVSLGTGTDIGRGLWIDTTGRAVVSGYAARDALFDIAVLRLNTDGSVDTSFATTGKNVTTFGARPALLTGLSELTAIGGIHQNGGFDVVVTRYLSDGSLDTSFLTTGRAIISFGTGEDIPYAIARYGAVNNSFVITGTTTNNGALDLFAVRLSSNGTVDTSFATRGYLVTSLGTADDVGYGIFAETVSSTTYRFLITGSSSIAAGTTANDIATLRLTSNGALDTLFNITGKLTVSIGTSEDTAHAVFNLTNNTNIVVGRTFNGTNYDGFIVRLDAYGTLARSGALDRTFGTNGVARSSVTSPQPDDYLSGLFIDSNNRIWLSRPNGGNVDFRLRYLDSSGASLSSILNLGSGTEGTGFHQADFGRVVLSFQAVGALSKLYRINSNNTLDTSFDGDGILVNTLYTALAMGTDSHIYWMGSSYPELTGITFRRIATNGALISFTTSGCPALFNCFAEHAAQTESGDIVFTGYVYLTSASIAGTKSILVGRFRSNGTIDTSFGTTGMVLIEDNGLFSFAKRALVDSLGRTTLVGQQVVDDGASPYEAGSFAVLRLNSNGSRDTTFARGGSLLVQGGVGVFLSGARGHSAVSLPGGKIVAAGVGGDGSGILARVLSNGLLDTTFNSGAGIITGLVTHTRGDPGFNRITQDSKGFLYTGLGTNGEFLIYRYFP